MVRIPTGKIRVNRRIFGLIHQYILMDQSIPLRHRPHGVKFAFQPHGYTTAQSPLLRYH